MTRTCTHCGDVKEVSRTYKYVSTSGRCASCASKGNTRRYLGEVYNKGLYKSPVYSTWANMKTRCTNSKIKGYHRYGGRGIKVCERWQEFAKFYEDMGASYQQGYTLERVNNDGDYTPENCRWADRIEQAKNTKNTATARRFTYKGVTKTISEWSKETGIKRRTLSQRLLAMHWPIDKALNTGVMK